MQQPVVRRCGAGDLDALLPLVAGYHAFEHIERTADERRRAVSQLLDNPVLGEIWGLQRPAGLRGYVALCCGYLIEFGGRDAFIDELFVAPEDRGRGFGRLLLRTALAAAAEAGVVALHLEVERSNAAATALYEAHGFVLRSGFNLMSARLGDGG